MKISTKGHYAVQALVELADADSGRPVSLSSIAKRESLSQNYLEQLFVKMRKAGLVLSVRGPGGGYLLAKKPSTIFIGEIFEAVEENVALTECVEIDGNDSQSCKRSIECKTHYLWARLGSHFNELLYAISIKDVMDGEYPLSSPLLQLTAPETKNGKKRLQ